MNIEKSETTGCENYTAYLPAIGVEEGIRRLMNNKKLYFGLLKRFEGRQMANEIISNINDADFPSISKNAHKLKGVAANLELIELKNLASDIEGRAKMEVDCTDMVDALDKAVNTVTKLIETLLEGEDI